VSTEIENFIAELQKSFAAGTFIKLTLSNYKGAEQQLQRVSVRRVVLKKGERLMFQYRFDTRDVVKNFDEDEASAEAKRLLECGIRSGHLFTVNGDYQITIGKRNVRLISGLPSLKLTPDNVHDRKKRTIVAPDSVYLKALGITSDGGNVRAESRNKWKQINKFVEIVARLIDNSPLKDKDELRIVDMGSGKGYLTFALYDHLVNTKNVSATIVGIEERPELARSCESIARAVGFDGLTFVNGTIGEADAGKIDILIALHACDTATDDALFEGIASHVSIVVAAPCCHKELRGQLDAAEPLASVFKHGIMKERAAEMITDGLRALLLEASGFSVKLFEFVPTEHTPKNTLLVGVRSAPQATQADAAARAGRLMATFGIREQRLAKLLGPRGPNA